MLKYFDISKYYCLKRLSIIQFIVFADNQSQAQSFNGSNDGGPCPSFNNQHLLAYTFLEGTSDSSAQASREPVCSTWRWKLVRQTYEPGKERNPIKPIKLVKQWSELALDHRTLLPVHYQNMPELTKHQNKETWKVYGSPPSVLWIMRSPALSASLIKESIAWEVRLALTNIGNSTLAPYFAAQHSGTTLTCITIHHVAGTVLRGRQFSDAKSLLSVTTRIYSSFANLYTGLPRCIYMIINNFQNKGGNSISTITWKWDHRRINNQN